MSPDLRAGSLLKRRVHDRSGAYVGRVADLETARDADGRERVVALIVTPGPWGRLLGYDREHVDGPWLLEWLAKLVLRRQVRRVPWAEADVR